MIITVGSSVRKNCAQARESHADVERNVNIGGFGCPRHRVTRHRYRRAARRRATANLGAHTSDARWVGRGAPGRPCLGSDLPCLQARDEANHNIPLSGPTDRALATAAIDGPGLVSTRAGLDPAVSLRAMGYYASFGSFRCVLEVRLRVSC